MLLLRYSSDDGAPEFGDASAPTTTTTTTTTGTGGTSGAQQQRGGFGGQGFIPLILRAAAGGVIPPINGPSIRVNKGAIVEVHPSPSMVGVVNVSVDSPSAAVAGPCMPLVKGSQPLRIQVANLSQIWIHGANAGDGVTFAIRG